MGVSANQSRLMTLTARQSDLELRAQQISAQKMVMAHQSAAIAATYADALNGSSSNISGAEATYESAVKDISAQEKLLDMELTQINTEHTACKTEYDAVKSLISENTEKSFNVFG